MAGRGAAVSCDRLEYARHRQAFGRAIGEHQGVGFMLADNETEINLCRLAIWHAAWLLDQGEQARQETSMYKVYCSEALGRVVDRSMQVLGGLGITDDTVVERTYRTSGHLGFTMGRRRSIALRSHARHWGAIASEHVTIRA